MSDVRYVGTNVPVALADELERIATASERSVAAELRLAIRHWVGRGAGSAKEKAAS